MLTLWLMPFRGLGGSGMLSIATTVPSSCATSSLHPLCDSNWLLQLLEHTHVSADGSQATCTPKMWDSLCLGDTPLTPLP